MPLAVQYVSADTKHPPQTEQYRTASRLDVSAGMWRMFIPGKSGSGTRIQLLELRKDGRGHIPGKASREHTEWLPSIHKYY